MPSNVVGFSCILGFIRVVSVSFLIFLCNPYKSRLKPVTLDIAHCIHSDPTVIRDPEIVYSVVFSLYSLSKIKGYKTRKKIQPLLYKCSVVCRTGKPTLIMATSILYSG